MFPQVNQNSQLFQPCVYHYVIRSDYETKAPEKEIIHATSSSAELYEKIMKLLFEISDNIGLFKKTRQEVREQYPELFKSTYDHTGTSVA